MLLLPDILLMTVKIAEHYLKNPICEVFAMIGERLTKLRKAKKLTQDELGAQIGVSKYSISMYENNNHTPPEGAIIAIAKYFNVSMDYLAGLIDEPYSYIREEAYVFQVSKDTPEIIYDVLSELVDIVNRKFST